MSYRRVFKMLLMSCRQCLQDVVDVEPPCLQDVVDVAVSSRCCSCRRVPVPVPLHTQLLVSVTLFIYYLYTIYYLLFTIYSHNILTICIKIYRNQQDLNLRGQSPIDFKSISLTTRT